MKTATRRSARVDESRLREVSLTTEEKTRYLRHRLLGEVGDSGQRQLKAARVLCLGAGGLGSPAAIYLAAAGIGTLGVVDSDVVDLSNLQRQILYGTEETGEAKVKAAQNRLRQINPNVNLITYQTRFSSENAAEILLDYDVVVDGTDNFPTRYLANDVCVFEQKPLVYGSIFQFEGQATVFAPSRGGPCYRCLFPEPPPPETVPNCAEAGVLGVLPGVIGTLQATEAIKLILGLGTPLIGRLLHFDALKMRFREFAIERDPACPVCGENPTIHAPIDYVQFCEGRQAEPEQVISPKELKRKMEEGESFELIDVREPVEHEIAQLPGAKLMPMRELGNRLHQIDKSKEVVVFCHHGIRSLEALQILQRAGFNSVTHLEGGIDAWSEEVDPSVAKY